jgi:hypothetical protein
MKTIFLEARFYAELLGGSFREAYLQRRRHERKLNTINENPQISQMTQIILSAKSVSSVDYFQRSHV